LFVGLFAGLGSDLMMSMGFGFASFAGLGNECFLIEMLRIVREGCLMNEDAPVKCALKIEMITY